MRKTLGAVRFKAAVWLVCLLFCMLTVAGCGESPARPPEETVREALAAIFPCPNTAYRDLIERILEDPANYEGDETIRTLTPKADEAFKKELTKLYGGYFTEECLQSLADSGTLGLEIMARGIDLTAELDEIAVTPLPDGNNYPFTVTLNCATPAGEVGGVITGSAQCLPEDGGKISYLRWEANRGLLEAMGMY